MIYLYDAKRHLVCSPYSIKGLHKMAFELGINRCWFHNVKLPHYDIPKKMFRKIHKDPRLNKVSQRVILEIIKDGIR